MKRGFTLAELLIALAILGVIATFTIPKVLQGQQSTSAKSRAQEVAAMFSEAYQIALRNNLVTTNTVAADLMPYMNYIRVDTTNNLIDSIPTAGSRTCSATQPCIKLHNGGTVWFQNSSFGVGYINTLEIDFDPDGVYSGSVTDSPGKSVQFSLYSNGRLTTRGELVGQENPAFDPSWFSWDD